ncbi:MAG: ParA family protein [Thermoguttaceae bacterium]
MRSIAIMNQKGGVGKTTTAVNVAAALAQTGRRICLIDLDPQAHATLHLGLDPQPPQPSLYDVLVGKRPLADARRQVAENLWVVPSTLDLAAAEIELSGVIGRELILRDKLREDHGPLDYLLVDCPPSLGILTLNALAAVEEVFIPLQPHFLALHGLSKLLETIGLVAARLNPALQISGVAFCMYDAGTRLAAEVGENVEAFFQSGRGQPLPWAATRIFQTRIRRNIRLAEAPSFGQSIFQYAPDSHGAEDYQRLAEEIAAQR